MGASASRIGRSEFVCIRGGLITSAAPTCNAMVRSARCSRDQRGEAPRFEAHLTVHYAADRQNE